MSGLTNATTQELELELAKRRNRADAEYYKCNMGGVTTGLNNSPEGFQKLAGLAEDASKQLTAARLAQSGLRMKYFVLKPAGSNWHARASRAAMRRYAQFIKSLEPALSSQLMSWVEEEFTNWYEQSEGKDACTEAWEKEK